jgi:hypothetical protein
MPLPSPKGSHVREMERDMAQREHKGVVTVLGENLFYNVGRTKIFVPTYSLP